MPLNLTNTLVVGVSSRALFDLEAENIIFAQVGIKAYRKYQLDKENEILEMGTAFYLIEALLKLNALSTEQRLVEIIVMSRNSPETGVRIMNSIKKYGLDISRMAFTGGEALSPYIEAFSVDLFLSMEDKDIQAIINNKACAAAKIYLPPNGFTPEKDTVRIAFDFDAVLGDEESEIRYKAEGLDRYHAYESEHELDPIKEGPFGNLLKKLSKIQQYMPMEIELTPLRLAIVTARNAPSHMRVITTLRHWNVYVDEAFFLGGISKDKVLQAFRAHIFFDDQDVHLKSASRMVPSAIVPYGDDSQLLDKQGH